MGRKGDSKRKPKQIKAIVNNNTSGSVSSLMQAAEKASGGTRVADTDTRKNGTDWKKSSKK
jgi:hypothetical protein